MRKVSLILSVSVCLYFALIELAAQTRGVKSPPVSQQTKSITPLPIRKVVIYSNGMAYIERRGTVTGNAEINLSFKQSQIDDVLKSVVVLDLSQGRIGAISYNSSAPLSARISENPFEINAETSEKDGSAGLAAILIQLQGAKVLVNSSKQVVTGSVLTVERKEQLTKAKEGEIHSPSVYQLVVSSESGEIFSVDLADIKSVKSLDADARNDLNQFASSTASARRRDAKTISISSEGTGARELVVSYTVAAPIWKTTYRVVLDEAGKPFFQGWAIVDNVSEEDWHNVNMSLVSGSPISFIQPIQNPLYRHRPVVDIKQDLSLEPQIYEPSVSSGSANGVGTGYGTGSGSGQGVVDTTSAEIGNTITSSKIEDLPLLTRYSTALTNLNAGVTAAAKGEELGDLFEYRIEAPVTILRDRSALIPIIQTKMDGERVSIYNESVKKDRPMSGMLLTNTSNLTFEDGSMTVIDRDAYAGESLIERLKPKEKRLVSFAVDLGTLVTVRNEGDRAPAKLVKAYNGVLEVHYFNSAKKFYTFTNQTDREKVIFVEHPIRERWALSDDTEKPFDTTQKSYRFRIPLKPNESRVFMINERQGLMDSYQLAGVTNETLDMFVRRGYIDAAARARIAKLIDLKTEILAAEAKLTALGEEERDIAKDQARFRENIESLAKTPDAKQLIARYIAKAGEQETRLEELAKERQRIKEEIARVRSALVLEIKAFSL